MSCFSTLHSKQSEEVYVQEYIQESSRFFCFCFLISNANIKTILVIGLPLSNMYSILYPMSSFFHLELQTMYYFNHFYLIGTHISQIIIQIKTKAKIFVNVDSAFVIK